MKDFRKMIEKLDKQYGDLRNDPLEAERNCMPGAAYFLDDGSILSLERDDGDSRYQYGKNGFNFWAYASGYMYSNDGLFTQFIRVCEGQEPRISFFAGIYDDLGNADVISLLPVPTINGIQNSNAERYTVFTKTCVFYITKIHNLRFAVRVFPDENNFLHFTISAENVGSQNRKLFISSYMNPFLVHSFSENIENRWYREVRYIEDNEDANLGSFVFKVNEDLSRTVSVANYGVIKRSLTLDPESKLLGHEATTSRYKYVGGSKGSLHKPVSLYQSTFGDVRHVCSFTDIGVAGDLVRMEVGASNGVRYDSELSYITNCQDESGLDKIFSGKISAAKTDSVLQSIEEAERISAGEMSFTAYGLAAGKVKENVFNHFFKHLMKQVEFCSLLRGYVLAFSNSLIGIRDIFQALEGLAFWKPDETRSKILEALDFVFEDGRCPRQYSLPRNGSTTAPAMDLRPFIDQGVWVISTIITYLKVTGDMSFLNEECGYYNIEDEKKALVKKSSKKDSVLDHMVKIIEYLLSNRDFKETGCIRALYGDWNDALDGLGVSSESGTEYGTGVSVMVSLQVYQNLNEMIDLLSRIENDQYKCLIDTYAKAMLKLGDNITQYAIVCNDDNQKRIIHSWGDKRSYLVGSFDDPDHQSRHGLTSNAFWVLSGMYDRDTRMKETILDAFEALDSQYGFKTFAPFFPSGTPGVGRINKLPPGTAENGASYIHASAFAIMALYRMGCPEEAWNQLVKILPFTHEKISHSPYVMPNSYCYNEDLLIDGESMNDWQTGSANVLLKTAVRYIFGIEPEFDGVWIQPAGWLPFDRFEFNIKLKGCNLNVGYNKKGNTKRTFRINGAERDGILNKTMGIERAWISDEELKSGSLYVTIEE